MQRDVNSQYSIEKGVSLEGRRYLVRDNGAIFRFARHHNSKYDLDEIWTFGTLDKSGYLRVGRLPAHHIVATAYHGPAPSESHVVDHIDRDRQNNSYSNLRWITRINNVLRHPSTRKKVVDSYGSIERFFADPSSPSKIDKDIEWLRTASREELATSQKQLSEWTQSGEKKNRVLGTLPNGTPFRDTTIDFSSLTASAIQRKWKTPTEFPCCPGEVSREGLATYGLALLPGVLFSRNRYGETHVEMAESRESFVCVLTSNRAADSVKPWAVAKIATENSKFVHENIGSFFDLNGAKKAYFGQLGVDFVGDSIDDYC